MKLIIVESPGKIKTIQKLVGKQYTVTASFGHIRDLPKKKEELPAAQQQEPWAHLGIDVTRDFRPHYVQNRDKQNQIQKMRHLASQASEVILATDGDREGESIAWHLTQVLKPQVPVSRMVFYEITPQAISQALQNRRQLDIPLVAAQESRRLVDRLFGYEISPLLWRLHPKLSAGRVQSVALRLVAEREWERIHFVPATFLAVEAELKKGFTARLTHHGGKKVAGARDFDAEGNLKNPVHRLTEAECGAIQGELKAHGLALTGDVEKPFREKPPVPFITSTLQQEASRKLGMTVKKTMQVAQELYEAGFITYMRTDSPTLSEEALQGARDAVTVLLGSHLLPAAARQYKSKNQNAQEAHEAIRPSGRHFRALDEAKRELQPEAFKLYELVFKRTLASQMIDATGRQRTLTLESPNTTFSASGKTYDELGFKTLYEEGKDEKGEPEVKLPVVVLGEVLEVSKTTVKKQQTEAPARFSEPKLVQTLEKGGIGRPSTYAQILSNIEARGYIKRKGNALHASWLGIMLTRFLLQELPSFLDYGFTRQMEDQLDDIAQGRDTRSEYLKRFYFGEGGLRTHLDRLEGVALKKPNFTPLPLSSLGMQLVVEDGRCVLCQNGKRVLVPDDWKPDELTVQKARGLLEHAEVEPEGAPKGVKPRLLGQHDGQDVLVGVGKYGPYVRIGERFFSVKCSETEMAGLDVVEAVKLTQASTPRKVLRELKQGKGSISVREGQYGVYLTDGKKHAPLPRGMEVAALTYKEAQNIIKNHTAKKSA